MKEAGIVTALITLAIGLRMARGRITKKLGAFSFLVAMGYLGYVLTHHWVGAVLSIMLCALLPLIFIYLRRSKETYHLQPKPLSSFRKIDDTFFPHASRYRAQLEDLGFDEVDENSWEWLNSHQHHRFLWHPEHCAIASVCLCEQQKVAFSYIILYSELADGTTIKTTNYPFSSPLIHPPNSHWNHVPCEEKDISAILESHQKQIDKHNTTPCTLLLPDPEEVSDKWVSELTHQTEYNLARKLIKGEENKFRYTPKGYLYLWRQALKDFIRLC